MIIDFKSCLKIVLSVFILYLGMTYWEGFVELLMTVISAASPLLIGAVVAYIVNILMSFYERHYFVNSKNKIIKKTKRIVCMVLAFLTVVAVIVLVFNLVIPQLVSCISLIFSKLPDIIEDIIVGLDHLNVIPKDMVTYLNEIDWQSKIGQIVNVLTSGFGNVMDLVVTTVSSVFSGIVTAFMSLIFSIYLLLGKDTLKRQLKKLMKRYIPQNINQKILYVIRTFDNCFHNFIVGQCTEAVILGVLCAIGMMIIRLPYATMIGALIAFTALIPIAGAYIGGGVGALMIFSVSPVQAIVFIIYLVILQQLEGNLIYPRVVGSSLGLPAIWVLTAVTIGGGIMGVAGMLVGVPLAASIYQMIKDDVNKPAVH